MLLDELLTVVRSVMSRLYCGYDFGTVDFISSFEIIYPGHTEQMKLQYSCRPLPLTPIDVKICHIALLIDQFLRIHDYSMTFKRG